MVEPNIIILLGGASQEVPVYDIDFSKRLLPNIVQLTVETCENGGWVCQLNFGPRSEQTWFHSRPLRFVA